MKLLAVLLLSAVTFAQTPKPAPRPDDATLSTVPDGRTIYINDFFGFRYTVPAGMEMNDNFLDEHQDAEGRAFVLLAVQQEDRATPGYLDMLVIMADRNTTPTIKTAGDYLAQTATSHFDLQKFEIIHPLHAVTLAGRPFARVDYHKGDVYQTLLATLWRGYALVFNLAAPTTNSIDQLVSSLDTLQFPASPARPTSPNKPTTKPNNATTKPNNPTTPNKPTTKPAPPR